jgi:DNA invertase Pin-like site-specific DNA recombinase
MSARPTLAMILAAGDGRRRGENHPSAKLTAQDVKTIRAALARGAAPATIARLYGVSRQSIGMIRDGLTWKEVV